MDAAMSYATSLALVFATVACADRRLQQRLAELVEAHRQEIEQLVMRFVLTEITPQTTLDFERRLAERVREFARQVAELTYNSIEPSDPEQAPHDVVFQGSGYRRVNKKTDNAHVATLFGTIRLRRFLFRHWDRDSGESAIFPLELQLGLLHGATPALANAAAGYLAQAGVSQQIVLQRLRSQHGVSMGVERLRNLAATVSQAMERYLREFQALRILALLAEAQKSSGNRKPVLAVGRDGVTLRENRHSLFENATVGTVTVYDRAGGRLGTVYLAFPPELGQHQMTIHLTALVRDILRAWKGPLPRLCYVTDAGAEESKYFRRVLQRMRHPRTGERLSWQRIVDYYHASERIWRMAEALFGAKSKDGYAWARRMQRLLKTPSGPYKVLHAAAALRGRRKLSKARSAMYRKAYNYIRRRTKFMQYHDYKSQHLPIGSGITEAACKTIFAQRMKLSGMRWGKSGAQIILTLRCALLSGVWEPVYRQLLQNHSPCELRTYHSDSSVPLTFAA
jgi:hypothetical protein